MSPHADPKQLAWIAHCIAWADRRHTPEEIEAAARALARPPRTPAQESLKLS